MWISIYVYLNGSPCVNPSCFSVCLTAPADITEPAAGSNWNHRCSAIAASPSGELSHIILVLCCFICMFVYKVGLVRVSEV